MIQSIETNSHQTYSSHSTSNLGMTPEQEKQLNEDMEAIAEAASKPPGPEKDAAMAVAEQKYQMDDAIFTASPPLTQDQQNTLQADYAQTVKDSQITDPEKLETQLQLDSAKFNMDLIICTHPALSKDQIDTLEKDFAQLEIASQNPDRKERYTQMEVANDRLKLDQTLFTNPNLTPSQIGQLEKDFAKLQQDARTSSDPMQIAIDDALLQKDTIESIYPLTPQEKSALDAAYQKAVDDMNTGDPKTRAPRVQIDLTKLDVLESKIIYNHTHQQSK